MQFWAHKGPYGPIRALWAHMGPNPDRAPTRTGPQPGLGPNPGPGLPETYKLENGSCRSELKRPAVSEYVSPILNDTVGEASSELQKRKRYKPREIRVKPQKRKRTSLKS